MEAQFGIVIDKLDGELKKYVQDQLVEYKKRVGGNSTIKGLCDYCGKERETQFLFQVGNQKLHYNCIPCDICNERNKHGSFVGPGYKCYNCCSEEMAEIIKKNPKHEEWIFNNPQFADWQTRVFSIDEVISISKSIS